MDVFAEDVAGVDEGATEDEAGEVDEAGLVDEEDELPPHDPKANVESIRTNGKIFFDFIFINSFLK
ncbi:MAG TPA: hypothetical protein DCY93_04230 [Firmicutes bacterium]|nr:hypothetical protein [Bacillota bacterium]